MTKKFQITESSEFEVQDNITKSPHKRATYKIKINGREINCTFLVPFDLEPVNEQVDLHMEAETAIERSLYQLGSKEAVFEFNGSTFFLSN